jgi:hypothetical protein
MKRNVDMNAPLLPKYFPHNQKRPRGTNENNKGKTILNTHTPSRLRTFE